MVLWAYEMVRWGPQMDRSVYGRVLRAYGKDLPVYGMVLGDHPGFVLLRAAVSVSRWSLPDPALPHSSDRS